MDDRKLLELAAKAAGYKLKWGEAYIVGDDEVDCTDLAYVVSGHPDEADWHWNPLTDDGDALRLAVKLNISILRPVDGDNPEHFGTYAMLPNQSDCGRVRDGGDAYAAARRAIVRAAAAIGEQMP